MEIITADWESYYDKDYSLSKITTEEYVRSDRFQAIMLGLKMPDGSHRVITGTHKDIQYQLDAIDWGKYAVLCHNTLFDGAIFSWRFNVKPKVWLDTLSMGRAMFGNKGNSLKALATYYGLEEKGTYVANMMGRSRESMSPAEFKLYSEYCLHDCDLTLDIFNLMSQGWYNLENADKRDPFEVKELRLIDSTIRMFTEPVLRLDHDRLVKHLQVVKDRKEELLGKSGVSKDILMSNPKFAELLLSLGVVPPMKISPATGKEAFAFAKTDEAMKNLLEHPNIDVQAVVAARMGVKSTIEETRTERFISISTRGLFPIPLRYCAAHTKRWGGTDKINMQNLPARGVNAGHIKHTILPPEGYVIIDCDSSNIEARGLGWLAEQDDLTEDFRNKVDVYIKMAEAVYLRELNKNDNPLERFVGKTCVAGETLVLSDTGWKPIESISTLDRLWDGEEFVCHHGVIKNGLKSVVNLSGIWLTPDHLILCGMEWLETKVCLEESNILGLALDTGVANLPLQAIFLASEKVLNPYLLNVTVAPQNIVWMGIILKHLNQPVAMSVDLKEPINRLWINIIGCTQKLCQMMSIEKDYLTGLAQQLQDVIHLHLKHLSTMEDEVYRYVLSGEIIEQHSLNMCNYYLDGIIQIMTWIEQTIIKVMNQVILGLYLEPRICLTEEKLTICNQKWTCLNYNYKNYKKKMNVYDVINCGTKNRFTILTKQGPIIVHNCVLGAGYGTGGTKLQATLKAANPPVDLHVDECNSIIKTYRATYPMIVALWRQADKAIQAMHDDQSMWLGKDGVLFVDGKRGIRLPNGLYLTYSQLHRVVDEETGKMQWLYKGDYGQARLYGAKLIENVCQALARIVIGEQLLRVAKKYKVVMTVHDAIAIVARKNEALEAQAFLEKCMQWVPAWATGWPLNCESGIGNTYGEC